MPKEATQATAGSTKLPMICWVCKKPGCRASNHKREQAGKDPDKMESKKVSKAVVERSTVTIYNDVSDDSTGDMTDIKCQTSSIMMKAVVGHTDNVDNVDQTCPLTFMNVNIRGNKDSVSHTALSKRQWSRNSID